jgi:hypothetical protein
LKLYATLLLTPRQGLYISNAAAVIGQAFDAEANLQADEEYSHNKQKQEKYQHGQTSIACDVIQYAISEDGSLF